MIPTHIIEKAIAGGWIFQNSKKIEVLEGGFRGTRILVTYKDEYRRYPAYEEIALDPDFWMALGLACGWAGGETTAEMFATTQAHKFLDLILSKASQDDIAAFWKSL